MLIQNIQLVLLLASGVIILGIVFVAVKKRSKKADDKDIAPVSTHHEQEEYARVIAREPREVKEKEGESHSPHDDFMMISLHAVPGKVFTDYHFLQILGAAGLVYGDHKIFHYDVKTDIGVQRLFSLAQLNNPGTFDLGHVERINSKGLLLFIDLRHCRKRVLALDCMLEVAYQLAEDLDATMFEGYNIPWQDDTPRALAKRLEGYQKNTVGSLNEVAC